MADTTQQNSEKAVARRIRAKCSYPYFDMNSSLEVARSIHEKQGGSCSVDQLADVLGYRSVLSGAFTTRKSAALQFGFVASSSDKIVVTDRAHKILNPISDGDANSARVEAFLSVNLFKNIYEKYRGVPLPTKDGLKNLLLRDYGLSKNRVDPTIRVFLDSAEQSGFLSKNGGKYRLVEPSIQAEEKLPPEEKPETPEVEIAATETAEARSAIMAILKVLPEHKTKMEKSEKLALIKVFEGMLDVCYPTEDGNDEE